MYQFVRHVLHWDATDYGYWISYRNLLAALGITLHFVSFSGSLEILSNIRLRLKKKIEGQTNAFLIFRITVSCATVLSGAEAQRYSVDHHRGDVHSVGVWVLRDGERRGADLPHVAGTRR